MKRDNYHSSAFITTLTTSFNLSLPYTQHIQNLGENRLQLLQFAIDRDAQGLEGFCRRMYRSWFIRSASGSQFC
jgi:hypothetical protein